MGRKIIRILTSILFLLCVLGITVVIYAEKNPGNALFKPLPYIDTPEPSDESANPSDNKADSSSKPSASGSTSTSGKPSSTPGSSPSQRPSSVELNVPMIFQRPKYPTGCEPVAATMLLNFYGYNISEDDFVGKMPRGSYPYVAKDGKRYGPDPNQAFVGRPEDPNSWGIYAPGLKNIIDSYLVNSSCVNITGCSVDELYDLLGKGKPVIVWGTIGMSAPYDGLSWYIEGSDKFFKWIKREHCFVIVGYDNEGNFIFNDPLEGKVTYKKVAFIKAFEALGRQALFIEK